jgi:CRISPR type IV-associated protein Csf3
MAFRESFVPLKITAHLRTGVISDRWLPLDAILLYQASRQRFGVQCRTLAGGESESKDVSMPLAIVHSGKHDWYYACSWAQPQPWWVEEGHDYWNKRFDQNFAYLVNFGGKRGKVIIEKGRYKAYHTPVFYYVALQIEWYCVGDGAEIERLLSTVTHIGKKRSQGWGRVSQWEIEPCSEDWSVRRDGQLTRGVPMQDAGGKPFRLQHYGVRPSYYRRTNQMPLAMPGE